MDDTVYTAKGSVTQSLHLELIDATGAATPMQADLRYDARDPYAVTAVFLTAAGNVRWTFGRDLLISGIYEPTGDGDVHIWPCLDANGDSVVIIELCSPDGEALVQARTSELATFVTRITRLVAPGTESDLMDLDATIEAILAAEAA